MLGKWKDAHRVQNDVVLPTKATSGTIHTLSSTLQSGRRLTAMPQNYKGKGNVRGDSASAFSKILSLSLSAGH